MNIPKYLYHYAPKSCRDAIDKYGLLGKNGGHWAIYLAERPDTWRHLHKSDDLWCVFTDDLDERNFSVVDSDLDELLYWGKIYEEIRIPRTEIMRVEDYDKCPEDYDLQELVERADFAVTYLGGKIRAMVANGIVGDCMSSPPTFTMTPDHNWEITGYIQLCDSSVKYKYYAKLFMQTSEPNKITISRSDKLDSVTVGLDEESIKREIAKFPPPLR